MEERLIAFGNAIKALSDNRVGGYLVMWGSPGERDLQGEYFTPETDFCLDWYDQRPVLYHHGLDPVMKTSAIGRIDTLRADDIGLWAEAQLDEHNRYIEAVRKLVQRGVLGWSSGSVPHVVEIENGKIKRWAIVEGSLTPTPAEPRNTWVTPLKSYLESTGNLEAVIEAQPKEPNGSAAPVQLPNSAKAEIEITIESENEPTREKFTMSQEMLNAFMAALEAAGVVLSEDQRASVLSQFSGEMGKMSVNDMEEVKQYMTDDAAQAVPAAVAKAMDKLKAIALAVITPKPVVKSGLIDAAKAAQTVPQSRVTAGFTGGGNAPTPQVEVSTKYHELNVEDMAYLATFVKGIARAKGESSRLSQPFYRELADKAQKAMQSGVQLSPSAMKAVRAIKADELDYSTQSGYGDDWVPELWLNSIWEKSRLDNVVAPQFSSVNMPSNPYKLPLESTDPTVYAVPEITSENQLTLADSNALIPDSKLGTANQTLTAGKLGIRVGFSTEEEEDAIIPFAANARKQGQRAIMDALDNVFLNADDTASGNINLDGGTPGATAKYMMPFEGALFYPCATGVATYGLSLAGAAPSLANIRSLRKLLANQYAARVSDLVMFCDFPTYMKLLNIPELLTVDKYGNNATVMTGEVGKIDNIPVLVTNEMSLAATNGKVSSTGGNNLYGRLLMLHKPSFYIGYRRQTSVNVIYKEEFDAYVMVGTVRPAFTRRDNTCAAVAYYIGV